MDWGRTSKVMTGTGYYGHLAITLGEVRGARSAQSRRGRGLVRRRTATSCRSTSSSAFFDADERPSKTNQPHSRMKIR
jgi:hypothetical protein